MYWPSRPKIGRASYPASNAEYFGVSLAPDVRAARRWTALRLSTLRLAGGTGLVSTVWQRPCSGDTD